MPLSFFVTGTDTEVGKTIVSGLLAKGLLARGLKVAYFKPVQSGAIASSDAATPWLSPDVLSIQTLVPELPTVCGYALPLAAAPELAAEAAQIPVLVSRLDGLLVELVTNYEVVIVEGAGGLAVPLGAGLTVAGLIRRWQLPVVLVGRSHLGAINHTTLSLLYCHQRGIPVLGTVLNDVNPEINPSDPVIATAPRFIRQLVEHHEKNAGPIYHLPYQTEADLSPLAPLIETIVAGASALSQRGLI